MQIVEQELQSRDTLVAGFSERLTSPEAGQNCQVLGVGVERERALVFDKLINIVLSTSSE